MAGLTAQERTAQVRIQLQTQNEEIQLPDTGPILVSTEFKRYQLSTLVNRLLDTTKPIPLEFLINGQFLRTSLDDFLTQNGISGELTLNVEYVKALIPPLYVGSYLHDDWVSCVDVMSLSSKAGQWASKSNKGPLNSRILSGSYDGNIRVWNMSSEVVATGSGHTSGVKTAKFISPTHIAAAGVNRVIKVWRYQDSETDPGTLTPTLDLHGHKSSVDDLAVHAPSSRILSASADHTIGIWSTKKEEGPSIPEPTSAKRAKLSGKPVPQRGPLSLLHSHTQQVSAITFDSTDPTVAYSASLDHAVKTWDLPTGRCVDTRTTSSSLHSICHLPETGLIAVGTSARHVTLVDPRVSATTVSAMTLRGHGGFVVALDTDPNSGYQFVSGSHDGTCRIWDVRSARRDEGSGVGGKVGESVYVIERESAKGSTKGRAVGGEGVKVFGVVWDREVGIASASEDKRVQINQAS